MKAGKMNLLFVAGGLFGTGLAISGMTDPARVIGFLDLFGAWDPALLFVMAGAVGVYGLGILILHRVKNPDLKLPSPTPSPIDCQLIVGSAIFGVGWGWAGFVEGLHLPIGRSSRRSITFCSGDGDRHVPARKIFRSRPIAEVQRSEVDVGCSRFAAARNESAIDMEMLTAR